MRNVAFVMHVYDELPSEVATNVTSVKIYYPNSPFYIIYDGVPAQGHSGVIEVSCDRAKVPGKFGMFTQRFLTILLSETSCDYFIKIDPDSRVLGRISDLPDAAEPIIFCRMTVDGVPHGGAQGFTRPMAQPLVSSGWLIDPVLLCWHVQHNYQDQMLKQLVYVKKLRVLVRRDFGWTGFEDANTVFSHPGFRAQYVLDRNVPIK